MQKKIRKNINSKCMQYIHCVCCMNVIIQKKTKNNKGKKIKKNYFFFLYFQKFYLFKSANNQFKTKTTTKNNKIKA